MSAPTEDRAALRRHLDAVVRASDAIAAAPAADAATIGGVLVELAVELIGCTGGRWVAADAAAAEPAGMRIPLAAKDGTLLGAIELAAKRDGSALTDDDRAIATSLAALAVSSLATRAETRERFLARASAVLAESLELPVMLRKVTATIVERFATWCTLSVTDEHGVPHRVAAAHRDPVRAALLERELPHYDVAAHPGPIVTEAARSGASAVVPVLTREALAQATQGPAHLALLETLGTATMIVAPLVVGGAPIGALALMGSDPAQPFDEADHELARELASRIGLAIDHARRFAAERTARERAERAETELRALDAERAQLLLKAEAASRAKDEFLAILGHELRNPLAPILTALELMNRGEPGAHAHEREVIARQTRHLVRLVDDLLDVSRIARGMVELRRERLELAAVAHDAIEIVEPLLEQRGHRLIVDVPEGLVVAADDTRLVQVVANLLTNAIKYTEPGGEIAVTAERLTAGQPAVAFRVRDSGVGIAPERLPHVFDMFVQSSQPLARSAGGLGLGLTIVRSLVEAHGGTVVARSAGVGRGTELELVLPAAEPVVAPAPPPPVAPVAEPNGRRVLVVDDNEDASELMAASLERWGFVVRVAHDGPEALAIAAEFAPTAAVLDIGLPVMDGYELARRLRAQPEHATTTLIAVTGYGQASDRERALAAGFDRHLVKPVSAARIREILEGRATS